jgi:hypothetical protein
MAPADTPLTDLAAIVRSKNAGPFRLTLDVIFDDVAAFERVRDSGVLSRERIAALYAIDVSEVTDHTVYPEGLAIKATIVRPTSSGSPEDSDVYGCQQHAPLLTVRVPAQP